MIKVDCEWDLGMSHGNQGFYRKSIELVKQEVKQLCEDVGIFESDDIDKEFEDLIENGYINFETI